MIPALAQVPTALARRFTRACYAAESFALYLRAVYAFKRWAAGRGDARAAQVALSDYVDFTIVASSPRARAMRIRPGRQP